jgi:hypothetical protein
MKSKRTASKYWNNKSDIILLSLMVLILAGLGWLIYSGIRDPIIRTQDDVPRLTGKEAYQAVMDGDAVLLDTRTALQFEDQRVAGAINIPLGELEARLSELDPEQWYITYCT